MQASEDEVDAEVSNYHADKRYRREEVELTWILKPWYKPGVRGK